MNSATLREELLYLLHSMRHRLVIQSLVDGANGDGGEIGSFQRIPRIVHHYSGRTFDKLVPSGDVHEEHEDSREHHQ